jgi:hypothetical protein
VHGEVAVARLGAGGPAVAASTVERVEAEIEGCGGREGGGGGGGGKGRPSEVR